MKFLADAHISAEMVTMLRDLGHDCLDASAIPPRMPDTDVLQMAAADDRVVLTADKDFGERIFVHRIPCPGVILIRIALADESDRVAHLRTALPTLLARLPGSFITVTASAIRVRPLLPP
jgi:predicted nuclease of predicted toxin-antitoxin system